jgi:GTPase SAR1 family protein
MSHDTLAGRENELELINDLMNNKRNIIIFGEEGVGKSAIVQRILREQSKKNNLYVRENGTLRLTLTGIIAAISQEKNIGIDSLNILALKKKCYEMLESAMGYIVLDHMGRVEPKHCAFLTYVLEKNIPLLVISRGLDKKDIGHLRMALYDFEKVEIKNFDKTASNNLIDYFMKEFGIKVSKEAEFKHAVFNHSKGNPKIIRTLCFLARDVKYKRNDSLEVQLMDLDRRISEVVPE